ncbi:MAG: RsmG family class I SAM-dependent methyltransferase [Balneolaceae bacterium]
MFHVKHLIINSEISASDLQRVNDFLEINDKIFEEYVDQLLWWNQKINLVSRGVSRETAIEHVKHSLLLVGAIERSGATKIIDTGTGGGLPGLPLAICYPEKEFVLNDIVEKKLMAVKQIALKLRLKNVKVEAKSIADISMVEKDLIITKHAFKVDELILHLESKPWNTILFLKGEEEVLNELNGIGEPLTINIINLDNVIKSEFYKGKAIVEVSKNQ